MPGSSLGPKCFQASGPPRACYRVPCCDKGDPSSPTEFRAECRKPHGVQGRVSEVPPQSGLERRRFHNLHSPAGADFLSYVFLLGLGRECRPATVEEAHTGTARLPLGVTHTHTHTRTHAHTGGDGGGGGRAREAARPVLR